MTTYPEVDTRQAAAIATGIHAVADLGGYTRLIRGIDRFSQLPTRHPCAHVWVESPSGLGTHHTVTVPLDRIQIRGPR